MQWIYQTTYIKNEKRRLFGVSFLLKGDKTMKKLKKLVPMVMSLMLVTPIFTPPKLPTIPNISGSITLPAGATEAAKKAGANAVKNLKIDWSKFNFNFKFQEGKI